MVISEIMYKPASSTNTNSLEFVEIYNSNPFYEDISGWRLSGGRLAVCAVIPPEGPLGVKVPVVITGVGFTLDQDTRVLAGGVPATDVHVITGEKISCLFEARQAEAVVPVTVENRYGSSTLEGAFRFTVPPIFLRGDSNRDQVLDLSDAVFTLDYLFQSGELRCADSQDSNDDGGIDISDPIYSLSALFTGGPPPPPPFPVPGPDPTGDSLGCE